MSIKNFKLTIQYDGTSYSGWQIQKEQKTIQGLLKECVQKIVKSNNVNIIGSGRTDAGVHSFGQVANFMVETKMNALDFKNAMNANLPFDVRVIKSEIVDKDFNSRFSAKKREYVYKVKRSLSPFDYDYYHSHSHNVNFEVLNQCAEIILSNSDFSNFCKHSQDVESYNCYVDYSLWTEKIVENEMNDCITEYRIRANRFLHHMVRMLVGTMLEVSKNRISVEDFKGFFEKDASRNRIVTAPSKGLYLFKVYYE